MTKQLQKLACILFFGLCFLAVNGCDAQHTENSAKKETVYSIKAKVVQTYDVAQSFSLNGRVYAYARADVRPQVSGVVKERLFVEGSLVKKGDPLYQIDDALYKAEYDYAKAALSKAVDQRKQAERNLRRYEKLVAQHAVSRQDYEDRLLDYALSVDDEKLAKAELDEAAATLEYTKVRAPISGRIGKSNITAGALVTENQSDVLASIIDLSKVYVDVQQSSAQWRTFKQQIQNGSLVSNQKQSEEVSLFFDDGSRYPTNGKLSLTEVQVDEVSGNVTLRAVFDNPEQILLPGMAVRAYFAGPIKKDAVVVPVASVTQDSAGRSYVFVIDEKNKVKRQEIFTQGLCDYGWIILSGVKAGDKIAVNGTQKLKTGMIVSVEGDAQDVK